MGFCYRILVTYRVTKVILLLCCFCSIVHRNALSLLAPLFLSDLMSTSHSKCSINMCALNELNPLCACRFYRYKILFHLTHMWSLDLNHHLSLPKIHSTERRLLILALPLPTKMYSPIFRFQFKVSRIPLQRLQTCRIQTKDIRHALFL